MCTAMAGKNTLYRRSWEDGPGAHVWSSSATRPASEPENGTWIEPPRQEKDGE